MLSVSSLLALCFAVGSSSALSSVEFHGPITVEAGGMQNIQVTYQQPINGHFEIHYGDCGLSRRGATYHRIGSTHVGNHPLAKRHLDWHGSRPKRFVWLPARDLPDGGCLHAFIDNELAGTSDPVRIVRRKRRRNAAFADVADPEGPWFDGVKYLQQKEPDSVFVSQAKNKTIGIIGGGMAGLMTSYLLSSVGMHNWKILEASQRHGGRVHTTYLNGTSPEDHQYQEMGPMRFPVRIRYAGTNETLEIKDHKMVFQLGAALNDMNKNNTKLAVKFVPWIQSSANNPTATSKRRPDGTVPGNAEVAANPAYRDDLTATYSNATAVAAGQAVYSDWLGLSKGRMKAMAANMFQAHKQAIKDGLFDYSESMYLRFVLHNTLNITDQIASTGDYNPSFPFEYLYFSATDWVTIDKGLSALPRAFTPSIKGKIQYNTPVSELRWDNLTQKVSAHWRSSRNAFSMQTASQKFDYAIVAAPFSVVRLWRLPPYSSLLTRAINTLNYAQSCKVALHYKSRFWEQLPNGYPIHGGCGNSNIPGIGSICYPSYGLNSSGPGVLLASYITGAPARTTASMSEEAHIALAQRAMIETHGPIAAQEYTGLSSRLCWETDEFAAGAWAAPLVGQEELYLPAYYQTEFHTVFVGEHTSFTHAWIFSALESAVRGVAQLLLDMGLVEEAKGVTEVWMARWLNM